jgi:hypothetical protein
MRIFNAYKKRRREKQNELERLESQVQNIQNQQCAYRDFIEDVRLIHSRINALWWGDIKTLQCLKKLFYLVCDRSSYVLEFKWSCKFCLNDAKHWKFKHLIKRFSEQHRDAEKLLNEYDVLISRIDQDINNILYKQRS